MLKVIDYAGTKCFTKKNIYAKLLHANANSGVVATKKITDLSTSCVSGAE